MKILTPDQSNTSFTDSEKGWRDLANVPHSIEQIIYALCLNHKSPQVPYDFQHL